MLLFGGSFNPIHYGHLIVARAAAEQLRIPRVVLLPCANPPHKQAAQLAPALHRLEMCRLAVQDDPLFEVSDWEIRQSGPNYTLLTVRHFRQQQPDAELFWLIGLDSLHELTTWYRVGELAAECTLVTAARPGAAPPDLAALRPLVRPEDLARIERHILATPQIDIAASEIRARLAAGRSITYLVPPSVEAYIRRQELYGVGRTPARPG